MNLTANPLKGFMELKRILKNDGIIILVLPHSNYDMKRKNTTFSELMLKYDLNTQEDDLSSLGEILKSSTINLSIQKFVDESINNQTLRKLHHHKFSNVLVEEICQFLNFELLHQWQLKLDMWYILKK